jgi:selenoprotein W-related protein
MKKPNITIEYCPKCNWLMRAAWMAQELLTTFENELGSVTLMPSDTNGKFQIRLNDVVIKDRKQDNHFPEIKELKILVRDIIAPGKSLGHTEKDKKKD